MKQGAHRVEPAKKAVLPPRTDEDAEVLAQLSELVAGDAPFDLSDSDEFIEGHLPSLDPEVLRKLRKGEIAVQGHVDLHGLTRDEAKSALERFLLAARQAGKRCVLVVHGRGLHSKDQIPVLKTSVQLWLTRGRIARWVLAFSTARPHDGGVGRGLRAAPTVTDGAPQLWFRPGGRSPYAPETRSSTPLGRRLTAGRQTLDLTIKVRILAPQPRCRV